jgi:hypothetical protein
MNTPISCDKNDELILLERYKEISTEELEQLNLHLSSCKQCLTHKNLTHSVLDLDNELKLISTKSPELKLITRQARKKHQQHWLKVAVALFIIGVSTILFNNDNHTSVKEQDIQKHTVSKQDEFDPFTEIKLKRNKKKSILRLREKLKPTTLCSNIKIKTQQLSLSNSKGELL